MINNKTITVLGSTGFIGRQTLQVAQHLGFNIHAISANKNVKLLEGQIRKFKPNFAVIADPDAAKELKIKTSDTSTKILVGKDELCNGKIFIASDIILNAIVGIAGLLPSTTAINFKKKLALANKESLVVAGEILMKLARENSVQILPIDSEHCAIFQCLDGRVNNQKHLSKLILTASGGPFFGKTRQELKTVKAPDALNHPTWNMGAKISIDSATMMNKGFELIEAHWLFGVDSANIEILIHRESIVHSMVEFIDHSVIANLATADMRIPIQYALTYPERRISLAEKLDFKAVNKLTFYEPDHDTFGAINICKQALNAGGTLPCVVNGVNESLVDLFLKGKISFLEITDVIEKACSAYKNHPTATSIRDIINADAWARNFVKEYFKNTKNKNL